MCEILKKRVKVFLREKARECWFKYMSVRERMCVLLCLRKKERERERESEKKLVFSAKQKSNQLKSPSSKNEAKAKQTHVRKLPKKNFSIVPFL